MEMTFEQYVKIMYGTGGNQGLIEVSTLKREHPGKYAEYDSRCKKVDEWRQRTSAKMITPENFKESEQRADAYFSLVGENIQESLKSESLKDRFRRLSPQEQSDIRYMALLHGRTANDGSFSLTEDDFSFIESDSYKKLVEDRKAEARRKALEQENRV